MNRFLSAVNEYRKPIVKVPLSNLTIPKNEPVEFSCVFVADPIPDVKWYHDNVELVPNPNEPEVFSFSLDTRDIEDDLKECTFKLIIPSGQHKQTGQYDIKAKNKYGDGDSSVRTTKHL